MGKRLCQSLRRRPQRRLAMRVGEKRGVEAEHPLVDDVENIAVRAFRQAAGEGRARKTGARRLTSKWLCQFSRLSESISSHSKQAALLIRQVTGPSDAAQLSSSGASDSSRERSAGNAAAFPPPASIFAMTSEASAAEAW